MLRIFKTLEKTISEKLQQANSRKSTTFNVKMFLFAVKVCIIFSVRLIIQAHIRGPARNVANSICTEAVRC